MLIAILCTFSVEGPLRLEKKLKTFNVALKDVKEDVFVTNVILCMMHTIMTYFQKKKLWKRNYKVGF